MAPAPSRWWIVTWIAAGVTALLLLMDGMDLPGLSRDWRVTLTVASVALILMSSAIAARRDRS
jgi:uncharacterized membrane protein YhaH (DUF805 family)